MGTGSARHLRNTLKLIVKVDAWFNYSISKGMLCLTSTSIKILLKAFHNNINLASSIGHLSCAVLDSMIDRMYIYIKQCVLYKNETQL